MRVRLAYGKTGLEIDLRDEWNVTVVAPRFVAGVPDARAALAQALSQPIGAPSLREWVRPGASVGIIFNDVTRPTPNHLILPAILDQLDGIAGLRVTLFDALGTHRPNTDAELRAMLGADLVDRCRIVQNNAFDQSTQVHLGATSRGNPIWLNRELMECDYRILTGFIEPHFFAGFSGGGKAIMPGMAGQITVLGNHNAAMIADPRATWGITRGNPIWEEVHEVARLAEPTFLVNVTLNREKQITGVFAGSLAEAHAAGCAFVKSTAMVPVEAPFDIIVTTNSGYPLDLNLYQAVKGMSAAAQVIREGGSIVVAADCWDGIPDHGLYGQLLRDAESPRELLDTICAPGFLKQDQWQAQIQAQIQIKADVYVYTQHLTEDQIRGALLKPSRRIEETLEALVHEYGPDARICVLPEGPQTVPYVQA